MDRDFLEHILHISRRMSETRALTPLLNDVTQEAMALVGGERGYTVLLQPDGRLDFRVKRDQAGRELMDAEDQISSSVLTQVIETGQPLVLSDAMADPNFSGAESVMALKLRSIMCVPLTAHGKTFGAIYVENRSIRGRFGEDDGPPLILFANQAAVAVENARLNDELEARVMARTAELEQAMSQLESGWAEAVEANRLRTVWLSNVAHDLGTPLSIISGSLSLLQRGKLGSLNEKQREWIDKSLKTVHHISNLIQNLFDLSKIETGGITLYPEQVSLQDFIQSVYDVGVGLPWSRDVSFSLEISPPLPAVISLDPIRIRQVLLNLLSNAHKFTSQGTVTLHAHYDAEQEELVLSVTDTGDGIAADKFDHVFQRFQQIDPNTARKKQGTGMGLAICRELVEMHEGRIWVESRLGEGSTFSFILPLDPASASP